jgi:Nif-specific regulatory protein
LDASKALPDEVRDLERQKILETLKAVGGVQIKAAKALGLTQRQLGYKLKKYGIRLRVPVLE